MLLLPHRPLTWGLGLQEEEGREGKGARKIPTGSQSEDCRERSEATLSRILNAKGKREMESAFDKTQSGRRLLLMEEISR